MRFFVVALAALATLLTPGLLARTADATFTLTDSDLSFWNATVKAKNTLLTVVFTAASESALTPDMTVSFTIPSQFIAANADSPKSCNCSSAGLNPALADVLGTTAFVDAGAGRTTTFTSTSATAPTIPSGSTLTLFCELSLPDAALADFDSAVALTYAGATESFSPKLPAVLDGLNPVVAAAHTATFTGQQTPMTAAQIALTLHAYKKYTAAGTVQLFHQVPDPIDAGLPTGVTYSVLLLPPPYTPVATVAASVNAVATSTPVKNNMDALKQYLEGTVFPTATISHWGEATPDPLPGTCYDRLRNGAETDRNCGGSECRACAAGDTCTQNSDCATYLCDTVNAPFVCKNPNGAAALSLSAAAVAATVAVAAALLF